MIGKFSYTLALHKGNFLQCRCFHVTLLRRNLCTAAAHLKTKNREQALEVVRSNNLMTISHERSPNAVCGLFKPQVSGWNSCNDMVAADIVVEVRKC